MVEFVVTFVYVLKIDKSMALRAKHLLHNPSKELYYNYFRLGMAALVSDSLLGLGTNTMNMILGRMGSAVVAANAVCQVVDRLGSHSLPADRLGDQIHLVCRPSAIRQMDPPHQNPGRIDIAESVKPSSDLR